jgi:hypothetical protein
MGREVRRVPPNWAHPLTERGDRKQPMLNETFAAAARQWKDAFAAWERGERPDYCPADFKKEFWEWDGDPPDRAYHRPWEDGEATWFQVWETVSEGTPVTPPFATPEKLIDYLVEHGDEWDQRRGHGGWNREHATSFVTRGWAPSLIKVDRGLGAEIFTPRDGMPAEVQKKE